MLIYVLTFEVGFDFEFAIEIVCERPSKLNLFLITVLELNSGFGI